MKRYGNLYEKIYSINNLIIADKKARKGKKNKSIRDFDKNRGCNLINLQNILINNKFETSKYKTFKIFEPKERIISELPYYPDRIVHHAIINILDDIWIKQFNSNVYGNIKGRGIHKALYKLKDDLKNIEETQYCLKLDIKKYYPSINHNILKAIIRRKIKDNKLLLLLDNIIDSSDGIPIGNYLSQYFANVYLSGLDNYIKTDLKIKYYYRYVDDVIILYNNKENLHIILDKIKSYLEINLKLALKDNYQIFPISARLIDFIGYNINKNNIRIRKKIKKSFINSTKRKPIKSIYSYLGWLKHSNSRNLIKKYLDMNKFSDFKIDNGLSNNFIGNKIILSDIVNKDIIINKFTINKSKFNGEYLKLQIKLDNIDKVVFTSSKNLINTINKIDITNFPFQTKIIKEYTGYFFT
jgi:retron-type reverse transcriptase